MHQVEFYKPHKNICVYVWVFVSNGSNIIGNMYNSI
jgi:hypothetical protein